MNCFLCGIANDLANKRPSATRIRGRLRALFCSGIAVALNSEGRDPITFVNLCEDCKHNTIDLVGL